MNKKRLEKLKGIVAGSKDLSEAYRYFLDHFGENEAFLDLGTPQPHAMLQELLALAAGRLFGANVEFAQLLLIRVPGTDFIHGAGLVNGRPLNVLYFDDIKVGIFATMKNPAGPMHYGRFSAQMLPRDAVPSQN